MKFKFYSNTLLAENKLRNAVSYHKYSEFTGNK